MNPKALPQNIINCMNVTDRKALGVKTDSERLQSAFLQYERDIQRDVENYCRMQGFDTRTPDNIARGRPKAGWMIHLHKTKKNPILLDLLLLHNSGAYLELELKRNTGELSIEQEKLVEYGGSLAWSSEEAIGIIRTWLDGIVLSASAKR